MKGKTETPYSEYPLLDSLPSKEKVKMIKETILELLEEGMDRCFIKEMIKTFEEDETYEAAQAAMEALKETEKIQE